MEENVYKEVFERTLRAEDVDYKIAAVLESHPESLGWVHGEPRVENLGNGMVKLSIPLAKYPVKEEEKRMEI